MSDKLAIFDPNRADPRDEELKELRDENKKLARALQDANMRATRAEEDTGRALSALRRQLTPLYRALQAVFGELDAAGVGDEAPPPQAAQASRTSAVWEAWKSRLGGQTAKVIDALLLHGEMNASQIAIAIGTRRQNIPNLIMKLNKAGLISKNGGRFSLKQL